MGALSTICLSGNETDDVGDVGFVPAMLFFGVKSPQAGWMRAAGAPRLVAEQPGGLWQLAGREEPQNYDGVRTWITKLNDDEWASVIPAKSSLSAQSLREVWEALRG